MARILGIIWIILGIIWAVKPAILRDRLKRKMTRKIKWAFYGFFMMFGILMVGSVIKLPGILPKIVGLIGIILIIKTLVLMLSKTSEKLWEWWLKQPLMIFRLQAIGFIIIGILLLLV
jgi:threonine/homoserine/homoserine lactone efflux protein